MEAKDTGDEEDWGKEEDGASSTSDSEGADHSNGPTTGVSAGVSAVGNSITNGGGGAGDAGATSSIKPKRTNRKRSKGGRIAADITKDELAQYFDMPTEEAAARLGIGLTVLKRVCRKHGVTRWPYRKVKSLDRLMLNVQSGVAPGQSNKHLMVSPEEILQHKEKMCKGATLDIDPETRRLQQAYSKFNHKLRKTHKYDLTTLQMITGSSSAEGEASQGALVAVSNAGGPRPTETSSQAPGVTLTSNAQEVDSSLRTKATDDGPDAASHLTGHPVDPLKQRQYLHDTLNTMRAAGSASLHTGSAYHMQEDIRHAQMQMLGQVPVNGHDPVAAAHAGGMMNILHSIPPWATLSTFLSSGAVPDITPDLSQNPSRAWLDMLTPQDSGFPSTLFSTLQTPSIPVLTRLTAAQTTNQDPNSSVPGSTPIVAAVSHPNILLQAAAPTLHPATHAFALNGAWQMPQGAVFNASLAILPTHNGGINTTPAVVGVTPFAAATLPIGIPIPDMKESSPSLATMPSGAQQPPFSPADMANGPEPGPKPDNTAAAPQSNPNMNPSGSNTGPAANDHHLHHNTQNNMNHNMPTSGRASGPRKRSVFEKVQQELTTLGSLPSTAIVAGGSVTAAALLQGKIMSMPDLDAPAAKRVAPNPPEASKDQQGQDQANPGPQEQEAGAVATLLDRLLPVSMFGGMPSGVPVPSSHSMLAHVMDPPVLLSVNLQSLHSLLPFFHSTEVPPSTPPPPGAAAAAAPSVEAPAAGEQSAAHQVPQDSKPSDGVSQDGAAGAARSLLPSLATFPSLPLSGQGQAAQSVTVASPSKPNGTEAAPSVPTASALPQAEAVAFLQAQAHSMSRLAQNQRLTQLPRPIPATQMLDMLLGSNTNMSQVSDAQALAVLQLSALEMGWVLESVEMVRISGPISSTVTAMPKTRSIRSRVTSVNGRPPAPAAPHPMGSPASFATNMGPLPSRPVPSPTHPPTM